MYFDEMLHCYDETELKDWETLFTTNDSKCTQINVPEAELALAMENDSKWVS